mgnify:CR=1 FL=1
MRVVSWSLLHVQTLNLFNQLNLHTSLERGHIISEGGLRVQQASLPSRLRKLLPLRDSAAPRRRWPAWRTRSLKPSP